MGLTTFLTVPELAERYRKVKQSAGRILRSVLQLRDRRS